MVGEKKVFALVINQRNGKARIVGIPEEAEGRMLEILPSLPGGIFSIYTFQTEEAACIAAKALGFDPGKGIA